MASTLTGALFSSDEPAGLDRSDFDASIMFYRGRIGLRTGTASTSLGFQQENVVNPPAHKVFESLVSFYRNQAAKQ
jgi:hypothetical protein